MLPEIRALVPVLRGVDDDICDSTFSSVFALCEARDESVVFAGGGWCDGCGQINEQLKSLPVNTW